MGTEHQIAFFVREISEADPPRRAAAVKGLGRIGRPEHTAVLIAAARDRDPGVRAAAAIGLGRLLAPTRGAPAPRDGRRAVERPVHDLLVELLADPDARVRRRAASAADRLELTGPAVTAALGRLLRDEEYHVRLNALVALRRLASPGTSRRWSTCSTIPRGRSGTSRAWWSGGCCTCGNTTTSCCPRCRGWRFRAREGHVRRP
ncbi:HEAT repeat domain-containing protein [Actinomadura sp. NPDC047616]|uniref:HEAT repeat domain-containing protein n=1 Tax=Actinomadura sp. NPDC047616 TaxID=3155914 RepID=UPI0033CD3035